jgi:hypothetical protein
MPRQYEDIGNEVEVLCNECSYKHALRGEEPKRPWDG